MKILCPRMWLGVVAVVGYLPFGETYGQTPWPSFIDSLAPGPSMSAFVAELPADVASLPPPGTSIEQARWLGKWTGWACRDYACDTKLVVERMSPDTAVLTMAFASATSKPFSERLEARLVGDELQGTLANGSKVYYRLNPRGHLEFLLWSTESRWAAGVLGREVPPEQRRLPKVLKGRNTFVFSGTGTWISDPLEIEITSQTDSGRVEGKFSLYSQASGRPEVRCYDAQRLPMTGVFDGRALVIRVKQSAKSSLCEDFTWKLDRGQEHYLEWSRQGSNSRIFLDSAD